MRTIQTAFKIPVYGTKHTVPNMSEEVTSLAKDLATEKIQTYVVNRTGNADKIRIRDLLYEGSKYPNTAKAFQNFQADLRQVENLGVVDLANAEPESNEREDDVEPEDEEPTLEDIAVDDEEFYELSDLFLATAAGIADAGLELGDTTEV